MLFSGRTLARALGLAILAAVGPGCSPDESDKEARGKVLYGYCIQCHQQGAEGSQLAQAPNIAGMGAWYLESQLVKFRDGQRGSHPDDVQGLRMRPMARTLASTEDVKVVAAYIANLPPVDVAPTLEANAERGKALYQTTCVTCHGAKAEGNEALAAPALANRQDWYLVDQLIKFRTGIRGTNPNDTSGAQMRAMALTLPDEQAVRDVAVYINTLE